MAKKASTEVRNTNKKIVKVSLLCLKESAPQKTHYHYSLNNEKKAPPFPVRHNLCLREDVASIRYKLVFPDNRSKCYNGLVSQLFS